MGYNDEMLKKKELEILDEFIFICNNNSWRYYLVGGTAIGAVRHKGFIPWDDDIDVAMPREDYDKFIENASVNLPTNLFFQNHNTDTEYKQGFSKIRDSYTTFIESPSKELSINHGIFIDVFPIDGVPKSLIKKELLFIKSKIVKVLLCKNDLSSFKGLKKLIVKALCKIVKIKDTKDMLNKFEAEVKKYKFDDSDLTVCYFGSYGRNEYVEREIYGKGLNITFEGRNALIPECFDKYLTKKYGDYMKLPPIDQQVGHHNAEVIDVDLPYTYYYEMYGKHIVEEEVK